MYRVLRRTCNGRKLKITIEIWKYVCPKQVAISWHHNWMHMQNFIRRGGEKESGRYEIISFYIVSKTSLAKKYAYLMMHSRSKKSWRFNLKQIRNKSKNTSWLAVKKERSDRAKTPSGGEGRANKYCFCVAQLNQTRLLKVAKLCANNLQEAHKRREKNVAKHRSWLNESPNLHSGFS